MATAGLRRSSTSAAPRRNSPGGGSWIGGAGTGSSRAVRERHVHRPASLPATRRASNVRTKARGGGRAARQRDACRSRPRMLPAPARSRRHQLARRPVGRASASAGLDPSAAASAAIVRQRGATAPDLGRRAANARPRGRGAPSPPAATGAARRTRATRPALARSRGPAGPAASSAARGRGIASTRSKRSRSARESLSRKAASRCGEQEHPPPGRPRAARAQVHGRDELEAGREDRSAGDTRDRHVAVLERLAKRLERRPLELGELVEKEHSAVREADLARPRGRARRRPARPPRRCGAATGTAGA